MAQTVENGAAFGVPDVAQTLAGFCKEAFEQTRAQKSCSHTVLYVLQKMVDPNTSYQEANDLIGFLDKSSKWHDVEIDKAHELANKGIVVIGGRVAQPNGHVIVVYPGTKIYSGGYPIPGRKQKQRSHGMYPRALSLSKGDWPGTVSCGDKTVWDAWGNDDAFKEVEYWTPL
jgi:hypothetical protein